MDVIFDSGPLQYIVISARGVPKKAADKHVHDVLNLLAPVSDGEFPFLEFLGHFLLLVRVLMGDVLDVFHQSLDVSETEKLGNKRLWRKLFEIMQVLGALHLH